MMLVESLFVRFYGSLRAYAYRFVNDTDEAEDIVQEVFLELAQRGESLRQNDSELKSYLFTAVYHRSLNHISKRNAITTTTLSELNEGQIETSYVDELYRNQNQECDLIMKELSASILAAVELLAPQCKKIFLLSRSYQLKNREIAQQLGITIKAVEKQLSKAISVIKKHLRKEGLYIALLLINFQ